MRRPITEFGIVGIVCIRGRNQQDTTLPCGLDHAIDVRDDLFGAGDVEPTARKHEVGLDIHFPEDRFRRDQATSPIHVGAVLVKDCRICWQRLSS